MQTLEHLRDSRIQVLLHRSDRAFSGLQHSRSLIATKPLLSCARDSHFIEGYAPGIGLTRTSTIMQGGTHCDFRYRLHNTPPVDEPASRETGDE